MENKAKTAERECAHLYAAEIISTRDGHRSRCLRCGAIGPPHEGMGEALRALRKMR